MTAAQNAPSATELAALLEWYAANGVDIALDEEPVDRMAAPASAAPSPALAPALAAPPIRIEAPLPRRSENPGATPEQPVLPAWRAAVSDEQPSAEADEARRAAASAQTLEALRDILMGFDGCSLKKTAKSTVFADGNPKGRVMFVGEAPGREEDLQGLPFVGRSGQLLDRMLAAIGLSRDEVYIANVIPWRPPGNRTPTPQETATCRPFIERQIALADPDFLVLLGAASARELLQTSEGILRLRGQWRSFDTGRRTIRTMATLHPAYLLRQPLQKRLVWRDLLALRAALDEEIVQPH